MEYFIGRLNMYGAVKEKEEILYRALDARAIIERYRSKWVAVDVMRRTSQRDVEEKPVYVTGRLVRYHDTTEEVFDEDERRVRSVLVEDKMFGDGQFVIHCPSNLIAYVPSHGIREASFRKNLSLLIEEGLGGIFIDVEIIPVVESYDFIQAVTEFDEIHDISIYLAPSNPGYRDQWAEVDKEFHDVKAQHFLARYQFLDNVKAVIPENSMLRRFLAMMADGYGRAKAQGTVKGILRRISSDEGIRRIELPDDMTEEEAFERVAPVLEQFSAEQIENASDKKRP